MALLTALSNFGARLMVRVFGRRHERDFRDPQDEFSWDEVPPWAIQIIDKQDLTITMLRELLEYQETIMATYKDLGDSIARNSDATSSILQMLDGISQKLKEAQASNDPAAMDEAIRNLDANTQRLAAAATKSTPVDANPQQPLPAAPPETPPPGTQPQQG